MLKQYCALGLKIQKVKVTVAKLEEASKKAQFHEETGLHLQVEVEK